MAKSTELALARNADLIPQDDWDFNRYVHAGRRVEQYRATTVSQAAWILGDLALGVETRYGSHRLARYAERIGVEYATLTAYRTTARAWESSRRLEDLPWSVHQALASQPDRAELIRRPEGWTLAAARQLVRERRAERRSLEIALRPGAEAAPLPAQDDQAAGPPLAPAAAPVTQPASPA